MHLTGRYPAWWEGRRFQAANRWWASSTSNETTRDNCQRVLLGENDEWGTGAIPAADILSLKLSRGLSGAVDYATIRFHCGGRSRVSFKSYEQERKKWQGETLDGVWFDEEPPVEIYSEGLTRTNATGGITMLTATPLLGMTRVVLYFYPHPNTADRSLTQMTLEDAGHYSEAERKQIIASYEPYEREARVKGIPMLGSGRVFPIADSQIAVKPFEHPPHWPVLGGIDFGWDHPTAAVLMAHDRDSDCLYIMRAYKQGETTPAHHASTLRRWGSVLWAWPHDGYQHDKGSGKTLAELYRQEGLKMLREHASFEDGGFGLEAGLMEMLDRMRGGRWKVFDHLESWFQEIHTYHRKDGKVVKEMDDLLSASRVAMMAKRFARTQEPAGGEWPDYVGIQYDPLPRRRGPGRVVG